MCPVPFRSGHIFFNNMKPARLFYSAALAALLLLSCGKAGGVSSGEDDSSGKEGGITYQLLVYSFADAAFGDKYGDIPGVTSRLDYIEALGAGAIWLSPIHPCGSYHGYDVTDYAAVNPLFGVDDDLRILCRQAHEKGIKVYLDYVLNHTSVKHPWFTSAKTDAGSEYRDYYIFSKTPRSDIASGKLSMFTGEGYEGYDAGQWFSTGAGDYWHSHFWTDMFADINYGPSSTCESSAPFKAVCKAAEHWIDLGIDGFRLDAVKHIYHNASTDENPVFLKKFYDHCNAYYKSSGRSGDFYMVGENLSEANEVAPYYQGLPAMFEFSFWYRLQWAINNGTGKYFVKDILGYQKMYEKYRSGYIEATKLSNHDEMRTASVLGGSLEKEKLAACVLLTASGEPYIYQGEELGYQGTQSGGDEYVRTPIMWKADGSQTATRALGGKIDRSMLTASISVESQEQDESSLLNVYRKFGALRNNYRALGKRGSMTPHPDYGESSPEELKAAGVWYRECDGQKMLVVHNFGSDPLALTFEHDSLDEMVASNGRAIVVLGNNLQLGAYSSAIFKL